MEHKQIENVANKMCFKTAINARLKTITRLKKLIARQL